MKQHIKSLPHHPKRVIALSVLIAGAIGAWGYIHIHEAPVNPVTMGEVDSNTTQNVATPQNVTLGFLAGGRIKTVSVKAGDIVKKDQVLATLDAGNVLGAVTQAKALYANAQANYQKVINGATGSAVDVAKAAVNTTKVNLEGVTNQQNTLVTNARRKLYSDGLIAAPDSDETVNNPVISGNYDGTAEGDYKISFDGINYNIINYNGVEKGQAIVDTLPQPLGTKGLMIAFPLGKNRYSLGDSWTVHIPNKSGENYTTNLNAYQSALQNKDQVIASAHAALDQANATLTSVVTSARPEDVAAAQAQVSNAYGALEIATAAYKNTIIVAPADGIVTSVTISPGQIALPNAPAIEFKSSSVANQ